MSSDNRGALAACVDDEGAGTATKKWDKHGAEEMYLVTVALAARVDDEDAWNRDEEVGISTVQ